MCWKKYKTLQLICRYMRWRLKEGITVSDDEIGNLMTEEKTELPKYVSPLMNLANRYAQGTRPKAVGKMTELIKVGSHRNFSGCKKWYFNECQDAIYNATDRIMGVIENFKDVLDRLDRKSVNKWVEDLVLVKT
ncbi:MAG: MjaI family restriction endonuclease, partial [Nitrososphaeria archaeon]